MTNFNILFGDIEIYDINVTILNKLDDIYDENYIKYYSYTKRYDNHLSLNEEQIIYKVKCKKYSLLKFEDAFTSYIDENITVNRDSKN